MTLEGWYQRGWQVLYLDADDRIAGENGVTEPGKRELPHGGRGVLTFYDDDGKQSWAPPADDIRLIWNDQYKVWNLWIPERAEDS